MVNVVRWRYVCSSAADAVKVHSSYPRAPRVPGKQRVAIRPNFCWRGRCFGRLTIHYDDFATAVAPGMSESAGYLPGYTLVLRNTTRLCDTLVPESCLRTASRDVCLTQVGVWLGWAGIGREGPRGGGRRRGALRARRAAFVKRAPRRPRGHAPATRPNTPPHHGHGRPPTSTWP
jgi:hypothetical protein